MQLNKFCCGKFKSFMNFIGSKSGFFGFLILCIVLWVGFSFTTYKHYGITADEENAYKSGKALITYYLTGKDPSVEDAGISERQLPSKSPYFRMYPAILSLLNSTGYYEHFHLLNMLFAVLLIIACYLWLFDLYKSGLIAFCGTLFLMLTPRLFGDIPTNTKDYPFAVMYFISMWLIYNQGNNQDYPVVLGVVFGITQSIRSLGYTLYLGLSSKRLLIFAISIICMLIILPSTRTNFPKSIVTLVTESSGFSYWNNTILFNSEYLTKDQRPQSYLFIWILITTPLFILIPFICSFFVYLIKMPHNTHTANIIKTPNTTNTTSAQHINILEKRKLYRMLHLLFIVNLILYLVAKPVIYNALRHFLFLLPLMAFTAYIFIIDILKLISNKKLKIGVVLLLAINISFVIFNMIKLHPYEYIYFNELIGGTKGAQSKFELDYWGATYKEASEWLRNNISGKPKVYACNLSYAVQYYSHGKYEVVSSSKNADYIMCDIDNDNLNKYDDPIVFEVVKNNTILNIIRRVR